MKKLLGILACTCMLAASAAQAGTYAFSYTQLDGNVVNGKFNGTANGNLVTDLSHFSLFVNGVGFANNGNLYTYDTSLFGRGVISFDGLATNLAVSDYSFFSADAKSLMLLGPFSSGTTDTINYNTPGLNGGEGNGDYSATRWHVTAVPEPETYAMLLGGLALMGVVARRRRAARA